MKKWMKITLGVIGGVILLFVIDLVCIFAINRPLFAIKKDDVYRGLLYDTYICDEYSVPQIKLKGTKFKCVVVKFDEISLEDVNDKINNYFTNDNVDKSNMSYWGIDEEKNAVVVGMMDISIGKQNEFISNVFSNCCGSKYIQYIKENRMIEFKESIDIFEGKIIEVKDNTITVEVLKNSKSFKKNDKVTMKITRHTSGINDFYIVGNNVRITFNGMVETSNPAQIGATKIELITE